MQINKSTLRDFRTDFQMAVRDLEEKYNVSIAAGRMTYMENSFSFKTEVTNRAADGKVFDKAAEDFKLHAALVGLEPSDLGRSFTTRQGTFTIVGLKLKNRKYPVLASSEGKTYKFSEAAVIHHLK